MQAALSVEFIVLWDSQGVIIVDELVCSRGVDEGVEIPRVLSVDWEWKEPVPEFQTELLIL